MLGWVLRVFKRHSERIDRWMAYRTLAPDIEGIAIHIVKHNSLKEPFGSKKGKSNKSTLNLGKTEPIILRMLKLA